MREKRGKREEETIEKKEQEILRTSRAERHSGRRRENVDPEIGFANEQRYERKRIQMLATSTLGNKIHMLSL